MSRSVSLRAVVAVLLALVAMAIAVAQAPPARASCAFDSPPASPYRFTGVVVRTDLGQRVAYVTTEDGRDVVVRGTEATQENGHTTVDRTYLTGHTYQFHPSNASSPYQDSICSATLDLGAAPTDPVQVTRAGETALADGVDPGSPRVRLVLGALVGIALLVAGLVLVRRSRSHTASSDPGASGS